LHGVAPAKMEYFGTGTDGYQEELNYIKRCAILLHGKKGAFMMNDGSRERGNEGRYDINEDD
jgi:hypothetical protein